MVFNDITTGTGVIQECERICNLGATGITGNSQRLVDFTARINTAIDRFYALAFQFDALWNFDGTSQTGTPIFTTNLVANTQAYDITSFAPTLVALNQVFAKDTNGNYFEIFPQDDVVNPKAYVDTAVYGTPSTYELVGNSILLNDIPSYSSTSGLKIVGKRNGLKFATTDGSAALGIPSMFHVYLARYASYPYVIEKGLKHANALKQLIIEDEIAITKFISTRAKAKRIRLTVRQESNK